MVLIILVVLVWLMLLRHWVTEIGLEGEHRTVRDCEEIVLRTKRAVRRGEAISGDERTGWR